MRFDSLEQIRRREVKRSRAIRQRLRDEHAKKFTFKNQYDRAFRKGLLDYQVVQKLCQNISTHPNEKALHCNNEQKYLLLLLLTSEKLSQEKAGAPRPNHGFLIHLYALSLVEFQKASQQTLRLLTGMSTLSALDSIKDWDALRKWVDQYGLGKHDAASKEHWGILHNVTAGRSDAPSSVTAERIQDTVSLLYAEVSQLQELLSAPPRLVFENSSFIFHLQLRVGLETAGLGISLGQLAVAASASALALPVLLLGIVCMVGAARLYAGFRDIGEYHQSYDTQLTSLGDMLGESLGMVAEVIELALAVESLGVSGAGWAGKTIAKESTVLASALRKLDVNLLMEPSTAKLFGNIDKYLGTLKATRVFFSDMVPQLQELSQNNPSAAPELLIRGVLTMGLELSKLSTKAQESQYLSGAKLVSKLWSVWDKGKTLHKSTKGNSL